MISATVTSQQPITATVSASGVIAAKVPATASVQATVSGGVGPQGATGPAGSNTLANLTDVQINGVIDGDVLRYADGKWRDYAEEQILDGGNW